MNRRLLDFVRAALRYAQTPDEAKAARLLDLPYAGVPRRDARALVIAGAKHGLRHAVERESVALSHQSKIAAHRFIAALDTLASAYGSSAQTFVRSVPPAFALEGALDEEECETLRAVEQCAALLDEAGSLDAGTFAHALEDLARSDTRSACEVRVEPSLDPKPLPRHAPEEPYPVARPRMRFSPSSLGMFVECERRWFYRYVCAAVEDKGSAAALYGTALHWALEHFHQAFPRADTHAPKELALELDRWIMLAFEHFRSSFGTVVEFELQRRRARRTGPRYVDWFVRRSRERPFSVAGTEARALLELEGYDFIGYIDRIDREDATGHLTVIDYKTGSIAADASEHRGKISALIDFQLPFYYWVRTAAGDKVTHLALIPLKDASLEVEPVELEVVPAAEHRTSAPPPGTIGIDELERARDRMLELARTLTDVPIEHFKAAEDPQACTWCSYQNACRTRPLRPAQRFAR
jgi:RecB family exonuclease